MSITTRTMTDSRQQRLRHGLAALLMGGAILFAPGADAREFGVRVVDKSGQPVAGAAVCFGLEGNYRQFGSGFTNHDGVASMQVPNVPLVITVSKTRFSATRIAEPARNFNLIKEVRLVEGQPGPRCRAESSLADNDQETAIDIRNIDIRDGVYSTVLEPRVSGNPTHYRVSTSPEFSNGNWQAFDGSILLPMALEGQPTVYLQMRRLSGSSRSFIETRSRVVTVQLGSENMSTP